MREVMHGQQAAEQGEGLRFIDASTIHGPLYAAMTCDTAGSLAFDFKAVDAEIMDYAANGGYDAFILCQPHAALGWVDDGMRAMPKLADRHAFSHSCAAFVATYYAEKPCIVIDAGTWSAREEQAIKETKLFLSVVQIKA